MTRVFAGERTFLSPILAPGRAGPLPPRRRRRARGAALDDLRARHAAVQPGRLPGALCSAAAAGMCFRSIRKACRRSPPDLAFNTAVSFVTNTNWQNYGGESTMSYLVQMAGLTVQNFVSAATGIALAVALIRGFARRSATDIGNFWADLTRCDALHPAADLRRLHAVPRLAGRAAEPRRLRRRHDARGRAADHRPGAGRLAGGDQDARHQRRRLLQRQLGASLREPDAAFEPIADGLDLRHRRGADQRLRPHGRRRAPGLGDLGGHGACSSSPASRSPTAAEAAGNAGCSPRSGSTGGNMEGKEVRFGIAALGPVRGGHHRRLVRRGQRDARQLHAARRHDPADQHGARRDHLRRRRRRPLRHAAVRHHRRSSSPG